jgi:hypothetical protein
MSGGLRLCTSKRRYQGTGRLVRRFRRVLLSPIPDLELAASSSAARGYPIGMPPNTRFSGRLPAKSFHWRLQKQEARRPGRRQLRQVFPRPRNRLRQIR